MRKIISLLLLLFITFSTYAWDNAGHLIVAQIAYDNLTPEAKKWIQTLVQESNNITTDNDNFTTLATWPDRIKEKDIHIFDEWHTVYKPYSTDGTALIEPDENNGIIWALREVGNILQSPNSKPYQKAFALVFCEHLIGDLHNPLHAINFFSKQHLKGDHGGDFFFVKIPNMGTSINLHDYWDIGLGLYSDFDKKSLDEQNTFIKYEANRIEKLHPKNENINAENSNDLGKMAVQWANESYALGKEIYNNVHENETYDPVYLKKGQREIETRFTEAGYRLANYLNKIAKSQ